MTRLSSRPASLVPNSPGSEFALLSGAASPLGVGVIARDASLRLVDIEVTGTSVAALDLGAGDDVGLVGSDIHDNAGAAMAAGWCLATDRPQSVLAKWGQRRQRADARDSRARRRVPRFRAISSTGRRRVYFRRLMPTRVSCSSLRTRSRPHHRPPGPAPRGADEHHRLPQDRPIRHSLGILGRGISPVFLATDLRTTPPLPEVVPVGFHEEAIEVLEAEQHGAHLQRRFAEPTQDVRACTRSTGRG